jgi:hypothetical protein
MRRTIHILIAIPLALAGALTAGSAYAHLVPAPCDFITGGGWVMGDFGAKVNFGAHAGCKNGAFFGHVNVLEHSTNPPMHLRSTRITAYLMDPSSPNAREICGEGVFRDASGNNSNVKFVVIMEDNGEPGGDDRFGVTVIGVGSVSLRELGPPGPTGGGGNIQLHKPNKSTTGPSPAPTECP